jgi:capsular exopolysaccharide synthesis family protein
MEKLVVLPGMDAAAIKQYQSLGDALQQVQGERAVKSVMITSAIPGEGKTLTAVNLALILSEFQGKRVLLVDVDLRQPRIHELFQVSAHTGLKDVLRSRSERKLPIIELTRKLALLPAGRPEPTAMLDAPRIREVLADASASFDWVIVDGPPVTLLPDANLLGAQFDAAILVIEAGKTPNHLVERAVDGIGRDRLIGVVLNRAHPSVLAAKSSIATANRYEQKGYSSRVPTVVAVDAGNPGQVS